MKNKLLRKILTIIRNLFGHGNLESIHSDFDLLAEKGEMAVVVKKETQEEKSNTRQDNSHHIFSSEPEYQFDDETLKKIYETINKIKLFEEKTNKLRHIKFAKRDKVV